MQGGVIGKAVVAMGSQGWLNGLGATVAAMFAIIAGCGSNFLHGAEPEAKLNVLLICVDDLKPLLDVMETRWRRHRI